MKQFLSIGLLFFLLSCSKDQKTCYQCDISQTGTGTYTYVGCFTDEEWSRYNLTDNLGNDLNKSQRCRRQ